MKYKDKSFTKINYYSVKTSLRHTKPQGAPYKKPKASFTLRHKNI